jgi:hypothetical protein
MVAEDASRLLCESCIADYAFKHQEIVRPAVVVAQGKSLCWTHYLEFGPLDDYLKVEYDSHTYPPSYSITRKR